jgi:hypothetical protein
MDDNVTTPRKITRLTARQSYLLAETIKEEADRLRREQPQLDEAAAEFTRLLGFPVGASSIRTAMQATGITWDTRARSRRREENVIDLDVWPPRPGLPGLATFTFEPRCRPRDDRRCGVAIPRHAPPAESAAWLRRIADLIDRHGADLQAVTDQETGNPADAKKNEKCYARVRAGWDAIVGVE